MKNHLLKLAVNVWIRTNTVFDGVVYFDAVARDPANPVNLLMAYNSDDLHLNSAGYHATTYAIDLNLTHTMKTSTITTYLL